MADFPLRIRLKRGRNTHAARLGEAATVTACGHMVVTGDTHLDGSTPVDCCECKPAPERELRSSTMTDTTPPAHEQGTHFWFMAIQTPNARGVYLGSYQGTRTPQLGQTRLDLFNLIRDEICREYPESRGGAVTAFDIQPNQL